MAPKLVYWTAALLNTTAVVTCAFVGWRHIRQGRVERHRRWMNTALILVAAFLVSYVFKVIWLGKEELELWSPGAVMVLRIHETFVLAMVLAGSAARILARRLVPGRGTAPAAVRRRHRWSGRTAVVAAVFALLSAVMVLIGMYGRA